MSLGRRTAVIAAALAISASTIAFVGVTPANPARDGVGSVAPPLTGFVVVENVFPLLGQPQYGDGLDAGRGHEGQDLLIAAGTPIVSVADGVVLETGDDGGRGNFASIYDPATDRTYNYFHMLEPALVSAGQSVRVGQALGEVGCTGSCWGDHLHFELRAGRSPYGPVLNPVPFLQSLPHAG